LLATSYMFLIVAVFLPLFTIEYDGLISTVMTPATASATYSYITIFQRMAQPQAGFATLAAGFVLLCLLGPICLLLLLTYAWVYPIPSKLCNLVRLSIHVLSPFYGIDVFVVSVLLFIAEVQVVSQVLGTSLCGINTYYPVADRNGDICFGLNATINYWAIIFGWAVHHTTLTISLLSETATSALLNLEVRDESTSIAVKDSPFSIFRGSFRYAYLTRLRLIKVIPKESIKGHLTKNESVRIALKILGYKQALRESILPVIVKTSKSKSVYIPKPSIEMQNDQEANIFQSNTTITTFIGNSAGFMKLKEDNDNQHDDSQD
jgi:hypothetical protein